MMAHTTGEQAEGGPAGNEAPKRDEAPRKPRWTRRFFLTTLGMLGLGGGSVAAFGHKFSVPGYKGPISDHFNGSEFFNPGSSGASGFTDLIRWMTNRQPGYWPEYVHVDPAPPQQQRVEDLRITFVNHSTMLIQMNGLNVLTDPVWSERISPVNWVGPKRHRPVGIRFEDLPPIDLILLSHNHYDHLDAPTMIRLAETHKSRLYTTLGNNAYLETIGIHKAVDMDWWDEVSLGGGFTLTCVPAWHFSNRGLFDRNTTLWGGFVLQGPGGTVYFAGDTGFGPFFHDIARKFPEIRLALLPIGAYRPRWFMSPVHMGPDEAVETHLILKPHRSVGIHFGTFAQADDGDTEPVELLNETLDRKGIARDRFRALANGESWDIDRA